MRILSLWMSAVLVLAAPTAPEILAAPRQEGTPAPEITVDQWWNQPDGDKRVQLADFAGGVVLLEFWAKWCPSSRAAMPRMREIHERFGEKGLTVISLTDSGSEKVEEFIKENDFSWRFAMDKKAATKTAYGVRVTPYAFLIASSGSIIWSGHPSRLTDERLQASLNIESPSESEPPKAEDQRGWLGVEVRPAQEGCVITAVTPDGAAAKAGLRAGDVITAADGRETPDTQSLVEALRGKEPGEKVTLTILRVVEGKEVRAKLEVEVTLGKRPNPSKEPRKEEQPEDAKPPETSPPDSGETKPEKPKEEDDF